MPESVVSHDLTCKSQQATTDEQNDTAWPDDKLAAKTVVEAPAYSQTPEPTQQCYNLRSRWGAHMHIGTDST